MVKKSDNSKILNEQFNSIFVNNAEKGEFLPKEMSCHQIIATLI